MRIIDPSFQVLDQLDDQSLAVRIEFCGRICYKSEDRIDQDSAVPFVRKMAEHGHNSVFEMGVLTLELCCQDQQQISAFFRCQPKYLQTDCLEGDRLLVTGSIRAFRDLSVTANHDPVIQTMTGWLRRTYPYFFDGLPKGDAGSAPALPIRKVPLDTIDILAPPLLARHRYLAVKFIVNRAVTHELVRHRPCAFLQESQRYCRYADDKFGSEVTFIRPLFWPEDSPEFATWKKAMTETERLYIDLLATSSPQAARTVLPNSCKTELIVYTNLSEWQHIFGQRTQRAAEPSMREVMIPLREDFATRFPGLFS